MHISWFIVTIYQQYVQMNFFDITLEESVIQSQLLAVAE